MLLDISEKITYYFLCLRHQIKTPKYRIFRVEILLLQTFKTYPKAHDENNVKCFKIVKHNAKVINFN